MADIERISITIDAELLGQLDAHIAMSGHSNRSEALRDMIRARLVQTVGLEEQVTGSLTVVFDHRQRALAERLIDSAHDHDEIVLSTMHVHLNRDTCMELSALRGQRGALQHYAGHVLGMKGVLHGELVITGAV
ncbi:MAG: nickel-responsive transcriptional regulator NikR [Myxococcota bacterium]